MERNESGIEVAVSTSAKRPFSLFYPPSSILNPQSSIWFPILRYSPWDAVLLTLALAHGALLLTYPVLPVIAVGLWWNSNTIAHNFIHWPFFRSGLLNRLFALYLSVLLAIPQSIWRAKHLAHHAGVASRFRISQQMIEECLLILGLWTLLSTTHLHFFLTVYLPAYAIGLALCFLHGYFEHVRGTISHYGAVYNFLFFNDGYHVEHHAHPGRHWTQLRQDVQAQAQESRWPAVLRWLECFSLDNLERWVLNSPCLQQFVLHRHEQAFRRLLPALPAGSRVAIVGGGLFPRTLIILQRLLPEAQFVAIDRSQRNLATAQSLIQGEVEWINESYDPVRRTGFTLVVIPLAYVGNRAMLYDHPPAPFVLIHDWLWRKRGTSKVVSLLLLKRLNLVRP